MRLAGSADLKRGRRPRARPRPWYRGLPGLELLLLALLPELLPLSARAAQLSSKLLQFAVGGASTGVVWDVCCFGRGGCAAATADYAGVSGAAFVPGLFPMPASDAGVMTWSVELFAQKKDEQIPRLVPSDRAVARVLRVLTDRASLGLTRARRWVALTGPVTVVPQQSIVVRCLLCVVALRMLLFCCACRAWLARKDLSASRL